MVTFYFKLEPKSYYDFLCGRVKVLETNLISEDLYKELVKKNFKEFVDFLQNYPYKNFITGYDLESMKTAIQKRKQSELEEFSKFGLENFINIFFDSKKYFILLKKIALGLPVEDGFKDLLIRGHESIPLEMKICFEELKRNYPSYIRPLVIDSYYLNFLRRNAKLTGSDFIVGFYDTLVRNIILSTLMRNYNFVKNNFISEKNFNEILTYLSTHIRELELFSRFKDFVEFESFLSHSRGLYSEEHLEEVYERLVTDSLRETFDKGRYLNEGIEPIFVYLLKLNYETSLLQKLAYALYHGVNPREIEELEFAYE